MKTLFLFTLTLIMTLNLNARENPFAATNAYEEEAARIIEQSEFDDNQDESQYVQEMQEKMKYIGQEESKKAKEEKQKAIQVKMKQKEMKIKALEKKEKQKILKTAYSKQEVEKLIKKAQRENERKTKRLLKKEIEKNANLKPQAVVYVKPRLDVVEEDVMKTKSVLPFLELSYNSKMLNIKSIYKIAKKFTLGKKIIIDYKAREQFSTKRVDINTQAYKKVAVGNHKSKGFFRVVIELKDKSSLYKVSYDDKQSISIVKINKVR